MSASPYYDVILWGQELFCLIPCYIQDSYKHKEDVQ